MNFPNCVLGHNEHNPARREAQRAQRLCICLLCVSLNFALCVSVVKKFNHRDTECTEFDRTPRILRPDSCRELCTLW